jgi:glycosyltransferase involved in cell wall biosynthesis
VKVCVDFQSAIGRRSGVGRYALELVRHLPACCTAGDRISAFYFDFKRNGAAAPAIPGAETRSCRWMPGRVAHRLWKLFGAPRYDWFAGDADVYHFPGFVRPPMGPGRRSVVTIHDVSFLRMPETTEEKNLRYLMANIRQTAAAADAVITDSRFSADEIRELLGVPEDRIFPIWLGLDHAARQGDAAAARRAFGLDRPYLLTVGTLEPRKNLPFLIEVFDGLEDFDGDLVLVGGAGWKCDGIFAAMRSARRAARIHWLKFVPDDALEGLYAGAEAFVFPSRYEGFGFPPLEAAARGTPVVCARNSSLPEVMGDAAEWVDGFSPDAWRDAISGLLADGGKRAALSAAGCARAARFSWDETARRTWAVYRRVGGC